jgi:hypothetical protein
MACRHALLKALRIAGGRRLPRIGVRAVQRLLAGAPVGAEHRRLARLLAAAAGPARHHELAGERAVLDAYREAGRNPTATMSRPPRAPLVTFTRALAAKVVAALAALAIGSAALAAQTGHLPTGAQQTVHDLFSSWGVPAPPGGDVPRRDETARADPGERPAGPATTSPRPDDPATRAPADHPARAPPGTPRASRGRGGAAHPVRQVPAPPRLPRQGSAARRPGHADARRGRRRRTADSGLLRAAPRDRWVAVPAGAPYAPAA